MAAFALIVASLFAFEYSGRKSEHFLASERASFVARCTETAKKALGQHKAPKYCNCLRSEIEEVYSYLEYGKFSADIERGTIPVEVRALAEKCRPPN